MYTKSELKSAARLTYDSDIKKAFELSVVLLCTNTPANKKDIQELISFLESLQSKECKEFLEKVVANLKKDILAKLSGLQEPVNKYPSRLEYEPKAGDDFDDTVEYAMDFVKQHPKTTLFFNFNGAVVGVKNGMTVNQINKQYSDKLQEAHKMSPKEEVEYKASLNRITQEKKLRLELWNNKTIRASTKADYLTQKQKSKEYLFLFQAAELAAVCNEEEKELLFGDYSGFQVSIIKKLLISYF